MNRFTKLWWNLKVAWSVIVLWFIVFAIIFGVSSILFDKMGTGYVGDAIALVIFYGGFLWKVASGFRSKLPFTEEDIIQYKKDETSLGELLFGSNVDAGSCPNCGESIVYSHDVKGGQTYTCSTCGELLPNQALAGDIYWEDEDDGW